MTGKLIVVGTPIGNLGDLSPRAVNALSDCDFIAAEDTRVTIKILNHFNIKKPMISYHEHNKYQKDELICNRILSGENCVLVSDAGMPAISDPGEDLVAACAQKGICVTVVPGPSAAISALAISGLPTGRFTFEGFLSMNKKSRSEHLKEIQTEKRTMIFYEAPHKLSATLIDLYNALGDRKLTLVRELTKIHEEVIRTSLLEASKNFSQERLKGEFVLIIEGANIDPKERIYSIDDAKEIASAFLNEGLTTSEAAKKAAKITKLKKSDIYKSLI